MIRYIIIRFIRLSSRHGTYKRKRIHERGICEFLAIPVIIRPRQTSIGQATDDTLGYDSSAGETCVPIDQTAAVCFSRVKLDPQLSRSVYGSRTVHGLRIIYIDHAIVHVDVNYCSCRYLITIANSITLALFESQTCGPVFNFRCKAKFFSTYFERTKSIQIYIHKTVFLL